MKNQYFGDLSDYKKYSILKILGSKGRLSINVCWLLTADDSSNDGRHTKYLSEPEKWRKFDTFVFDLFTKEVIYKSNRSIHLIEESNYLEESIFFNKPLNDSLEERIKYFDDFNKTIKESDLIFLDPDNGMEVKSVKYGKKNSKKYVYFHEVEMLFKEEKSLLIYQHFSRSNREEFIRNKSLILMDLLKIDKVFYLRTKHTVFLLVVQEKHIDNIDIALQEFKKVWNDELLIGVNDKNKSYLLQYKNQDTLF